MSIRILYGPSMVYCETAQEAATLLRLLYPSANGRPASTSPSPNPVSPSPESEASSISTVVQRLGPKQRRALSTIVQRGGRATDAILCQQLEVNGSSALGGILAAISKEANKANVDVKEFFIREVNDDDPENRIVEYIVPERVTEDVVRGLRAAA